MFEYEIDLGSQTVDLDSVYKILSGATPCNCSDELWDAPKSLPQEMLYQLGRGGYLFVLDTIKEKIDALKAEAKAPGEDEDAAE